MARIAGIDLPVQKRLWVGLTSSTASAGAREKAGGESRCGSHQEDSRSDEEEINHIRQASSRKAGWKRSRKGVQMNIAG